MKSSFNPSFCPARTDIKKPSVVSSPGEEPVFRMGELVMHPSEGICTVKDMKPMDFSNHIRTYYVLKPTAEKSSSIVYLPVDRGNRILRRLLDKETILKIIREAKNYESLWIEDNKQRKEVFSRILSEGDHVKIIRIIQELHEHHILREQADKKSCAADESILAKAERRLHQEFSHVLHMSLEETASFIRQKLGV